MNKEEQRSWIYLLLLQNYTPEQIENELKKYAGVNAYSRSEIYFWIKEIKFGRTDLNNINPPGKPQDPNIRKDIDKYIVEHPVFSANKVAKATNHSVATVTKVLREEFEYQYLHLRKVPHFLTPELKKKRVDQATFILDALAKARNSHNGNIITGDESWFYYNYQPKATWVLCGEEIEDIVATNQFTKKKMVTIFINKNGKYFIDMLPGGNTFNSEYFREVIIPQITKLAFPDGIGRGRKKALLHFDNAPSHKEHHAMETLKDSHFNLILNPPFSPDISPLDYGVFGTIKEMMPNEMLESEKALYDTIDRILKQLGEGFIKNVFSAWEKRLDQVIHTNGDYIK